MWSFVAHAKGVLQVVRGKDQEGLFVGHWVKLLSDSISWVRGCQRLVRGWADSLDKLHFSSQMFLQKPQDRELQQNFRRTCGHVPKHGVPMFLKMQLLYVQLDEFKKKIIKTTQKNNVKKNLTKMSFLLRNATRDRTIKVWWGTFCLRVN